MKITSEQALLLMSYFEETFRYAEDFCAENYEALEPLLKELREAGGLPVPDYEKYAGYCIKHLPRLGDKPWRLFGPDKNHRVLGDYPTEQAAMDARGKAVEDAFERP